MCSNKLVPVLFCQENSIYKTLGCDVYDQARNALMFKPGLPIIAHPPCRLFSRLRKLSTAPIAEKYLAYWSVALVQRYGGIVEQPFPSRLWFELDLPKPGSIDRFGGFSIIVSQRWFGHVAEKPTLLYIVGIKPSDLPDYPISFDLPSHVIGRKNNGLKEASKRLRSYTPIAFAKWLISMHSIILACHISQNSKIDLLSPANAQ